jgi:hypothetical protein
MNKILALAVLATLPAMAEAQTQTTWTGQSLSVTGERDDGCYLRVAEVTHSGNQYDPIRIMVLNGEQTPKRVWALVTMSGDGSPMGGQVDGVILGGSTGTLRGFSPSPGSLAGSRDHPLHQLLDGLLVTKCASRATSPG